VRAEVFSPGCSPGPFGHNRRIDGPRSAMTWQLNPQLSARSRRSINSPRIEEREDRAAASGGDADGR